MFRKRSDSSSTPDTTSAAAPADRITSVLSSGISWKGQLGGSGGVRIEGTFEGEIALRGILVVGETGRVTCQVLRANTVIVAGVVKADIVSERLDIRSTGRVWGSVVTAAFSTEEGAFLRGQVTMEEKVDIGVGPADAASEPTSEGDGEGPLLAE
ncbi:MAG TPA: polymer-forming cytoskeletal protein [Anaerolineales bacterium]|nr:polymer-forming cytoskeletal protein [Anaerolineales bacterium]